MSRLRPLESHSESNPTQKIAAPIIEEVSNLIPEHQKKVNIRIDHFLIFSDQGSFQIFLRKIFQKLLWILFETLKETFENSFPKSRAIEKVPTLCPVTGKPARYRTRDGIPYYDSYAYKVLLERQKSSNPILKPKQTLKPTA